MLVQIFTRAVNQLFCSAKPIERFSALGVQDYGPGKVNPFPARVRFAEVFVPGCEKGDILDIHFNSQVTNDLTYEVEVAWRMVLTKDAEGYVGVSPSSGYGYNLPPAVHHGPMTLTERMVVPEDGDWYVVILAYAGGSSLSQIGDTIKVDVGYGSFTVLRS